MKSKNLAQPHLVKTATGYKLVAYKIGKRAKRHAKPSKNRVSSLYRYCVNGALFGTAGLCLGLGLSFGTLPINGYKLIDYRIIPVQAQSVETPVLAPELVEGNTPTANSTAIVESVAPSTTPKSAKEEIKDYIEQVFGSEAENAILVASCESGLNPEAVGDKHLMVINNGDLVGDSIGVFQIRTGGKEFNRARANGMTPDEFRKLMSDPKENIKYAKDLFDRQGWYPWTCKKVL